jgi:hypothetical protein
MERIAIKECYEGFDSHRVLIFMNRHLDERGNDNVSW